MPDFPYLSFDYSRHDTARLHKRWYVRVPGGRKIRVDRSAADFASVYAAAREQSGGHKPTGQVARAAEGTVGWLAAQYFAGRRFGQLDAKSKATRRQVIEDCLREPVRPGTKALVAGCPIIQFTAAAVMMLMDRKANLPGAANNRKKYLSAMFGWSVKHLTKHVPANPCRDAERIAYATDGFHTWSVDEVFQFYDRHPLGTKARVAIDLLLFSGVRRGDVVTLGRQHTRDGALRYVPRKTRYKRVTVSEKPLLPILVRTLAAGPVGDLTFLVTQYGKPFTAAGFGGWFRDRCDEAGLPQCSAHGLKKAAATISAENGATAPQLMAMFNWTTIAQAQVYIETANQKRLAASAGQLIALPARIGQDKAAEGGT